MHATTCGEEIALWISVRSGCGGYRSRRPCGSRCSVFLRSWRQAKGWRPGGARFDTWMHRVALNLCYDRLRRRREQPTAEPPEQTDPAPGADQGLETAEVGRRVELAIAALPDRQREALVLHHYQDLSNIEIAALMKVSVEAVESLLARGRRALKLALADLKTP